MDEVKALEWIGSSRKDMQALPLSVRRVFAMDFMQHNQEKDDQRQNRSRVSVVQE